MSRWVQTAPKNTHMPTRDGQYGQRHEHGQDAADGGEPGNASLVLRTIHHPCGEKLRRQGKDLIEGEQAENEVCRPQAEQYRVEQIRRHKG
jgi:hypothetical protein